MLKGCVADGEKAWAGIESKIKTAHSAAAIRRRGVKINQREDGDVIEILFLAFKMLDHTIQET